MKLTVLLGFYNTPPHALAEAVHCLKTQDDKAQHEIILLDDGSTSRATREQADLLVSNHGLKIHRLDRNKGLAVVLNEGLYLAETEYVALMGDDVCAPNRLKLQADYLSAHPEVDVLGTQLYSFLDDDIHRRPLFVSDHPERPEPKKDSDNPFWIVNHATVVYKRSTILSVGGYDHTRRRGQDVDLWSRLYQRGATFRNLPQVLYGWRRFE